MTEPYTPGERQAKAETLEAEAHAKYDDFGVELPEVQAASMALIPITDSVEGEPGGPLNRRLAFELAEMIGKDHARDLVRFAQLVEKFAS